MVPISLSFNVCPDYMYVYMYLDTHPVIEEAMVSVKLTRGCRSIAIGLTSDQISAKESPQSHWIHRQSGTSTCT